MELILENGYFKGHMIIVKMSAFDVQVNDRIMGKFICTFEKNSVIYFQKCHKYENKRN